ncbi:nuclear transcription factor Y subunit A-7-like [Ananas comosus]|uniref:Nuclear transcription factor Y subunit n=1 Tax=Ananas comosus TaxID=4615 RepID=A0A6P5GPS6_ANACO|nr:nuclear transcription factor Y subunit A-7-like [Ananas comosus]
MTSSNQSSSDYSESNEQQKQSNSVLHSGSSATGQYYPGPTSVPMEYMVPIGHIEMGQTVAQVAYPFVDPYCRGIIAAYGAQTAVYHPSMGLPPISMLMTNDAVEPVYVNAKQYQGILRRRQSRAKAESENKLIKSRKPYLHESRHLHAVRRARGSGGRFIKSKSTEKQDNEADPHEMQKPLSMNHPSIDPSENKAKAAEVSGFEKSPLNNGAASAQSTA